MTTNNQISPMNFAIIQALPFLNNPKYLDSSYKMGLDFWIVLDYGEKKTNSILPV